ncbi:MAG: DUF4411 family protein [Flavobacteriales bacterium]
MPVYVLDSNFFIQAHRVYYPIDVASGFWDKVMQLAHERKVISIDKVKAELYDKNDAFLVAYCLTEADCRMLVTQEVSGPNKQNKIKIPDVCKGVGVTCVNTIDMFRQLGERF